MSQCSKCESDDTTLCRREECPQVVEWSEEVILDYIKAQVAKREAQDEALSTD